MTNPPTRLGAALAAALLLAALTGCGGDEASSETKPVAGHEQSTGGDENVEGDLGVPSSTDVVSSSDDVQLGPEVDAWSPTLAAAFVDDTLYVYGRDADSAFRATLAPEFSSAPLGDPVFALGTAADGVPVAAVAAVVEGESGSALRANPTSVAVRTYNLRDGSPIGDEFVIAGATQVSLPSEGGFVGHVAVTTLANSEDKAELTVLDVDDNTVAWTRTGESSDTTANVQVGAMVVIENAAFDAATGQKQLWTGPSRVFATANPKWLLGEDEDENSAIINAATGEAITRKSDDLSAVESVRVDPTEDLAVFISDQTFSEHGIEVVDLSTGEAIAASSVSDGEAESLGFTFEGINGGRLWVISKTERVVLDARTAETLNKDWTDEGQASGGQSSAGVVGEGGAPVLSGNGWALMAPFGSELSSDDYYFLGYADTLPG